MKTTQSHITYCGKGEGAREVYSVTIFAEFTPAERDRLEAVAAGKMKIVSMGFRAVKNEELKL